VLRVVRRNTTCFHKLCSPNFDLRLNSHQPVYEMRVIGLLARRQLQFVLRIGEWFMWITTTCSLESTQKNSPVLRQFISIIEWIQIEHLFSSWTRLWSLFWWFQDEICQVRTHLNLKTRRPSFSQYFLSFPSIRNSRTSPSFNSACKRRNPASPHILFEISRHGISSTRNFRRHKWGEYENRQSLVVPFRQRMYHEKHETAVGF